MLTAHTTEAPPLEAATVQNRHPRPNHQQPPLAVSSQATPRRGPPGRTYRRVLRNVRIPRRRTCTHRPVACGRLHPRKRETGGIAIARARASSAARPRPLDRPEPNPDGVAADRRQNAHGVELTGGGAPQCRPSGRKDAEQLRLTFAGRGVIRPLGLRAQQRVDCLRELARAVPARQDRPPSATRPAVLHP
jgi:hypothetical protein